MTTTQNLMFQIRDSDGRGGGGVRKRRNKRKKRRSGHELKKKTKKESDCGKGEMMWHVEMIEDPMPVGDVIESDDVKNIKRYSAFQYDGLRFHLEDSVLVTPEQENIKPAVAIIKGISEGQDGSMSLTVQWFYRPEEVLETADTEYYCSSFDDRELLFTNHRHEVPAETIMHKCVVHFLPDWKMLPERKVHPGFVVQYFYDRSRQEVYKITDGVYADPLQKEIDMRMKKTQLRIGIEC